MWLGSALIKTAPKVEAFLVGWKYGLQNF